MAIPRGTNYRALGLYPGPHRALGLSPGPYRAQAPPRALQGPRALVRVVTMVTLWAWCHGKHGDMVAGMSQGGWERAAEPNQGK